jgi:hypothetical protein
MFILNLSPSTTVQVKLNYVVNHEKIETETFIVEVKRLNSDDFKTYSTSDKSYSDVLLEIVIGWSKLKDEQGNDVAFSKERLDQLLLVPSIPQQLYVNIAQAHLKALEKN